MKNKPLLWAMAIIACYMGARFMMYRSLPIVREGVYADLGPEAVEAETARRMFARSGVVLPPGIRVHLGRRGPEYDKIEALVRAQPIREFDPQLWFRRDLWMTLPRLAALAACAAVMGLYGGVRRWGWQVGACAPGLALLGAMTAAHVLVLYSLGAGSPFGSRQVVIGIGATLAVASMEEALFRGVLYSALRERLAASWAGILSSLFFAAYHLQAQPVSGWPRIFGSGLVDCAAFHLGVGLPWLVLAHEIVDVTIYFTGMGGLPPAHPFVYACANTSQIVLAFLAWWALRRPSA